MQIDVTVRQKMKGSNVSTSLKLDRLMLNPAKFQDAGTQSALNRVQLLPRDFESSTQLPINDNSSA